MGLRGDAIAQFDWSVGQLLEALDKMGLTQNTLIILSTSQVTGRFGEMKFSVKIARSYWTKDMTYGNLVYIPDTEYGGIIGKVLTSTTLDYVELKGYTWRGRLDRYFVIVSSSVFNIRYSFFSNVVKIS